jgi:hypothetical protein
VLDLASDQTGPLSVTSEQNNRSNDVTIHIF